MSLFKSKNKKPVADKPASEQNEKSDAVDDCPMCHVSPEVVDQLKKGR